MELPYIKDMPRGGFNYDNAIRNKALLESKTLKAGEVKNMKTGTTICAAMFKVSLPYHLYLNLRMEL